MLSEASKGKGKSKAEAKEWVLKMIQTKGTGKGEKPLESTVPAAATTEKIKKKRSKSHVDAESHTPPAVPKPILKKSKTSPPDDDVLVDFNSPPANAKGKADPQRGILSIANEPAVPPEPAPLERVKSKRFKRLRRLATEKHLPPAHTEEPNQKKKKRGKSKKKDKACT